MSRLIDGDDVNPAEGTQDVTDIEEIVIVEDEVFQTFDRSLAAFYTGVACKGGIDEGMIGPFFSETAMDEEKEVEDGSRCMDKFLFIFPVEEGNGFSFQIIGDIPKGRAAVVQAGSMETGQSFAGFGEGIEAHVDVLFSLGDALEGPADIFHDEEIFIEEDNLRCQGQAGVNHRDFIGLTPEGR